MGPTLSNIIEPNKYSPVNAEIWYSINTLTPSDSELQDFKYIYKVYTYDRITSATTSYLGTYKIPSRPSTGEGIFTPNRLLKSQMGNYYTFSFTQSGVQTIIDDRALIKYKLSYGFEYNPGLTFTQTSLVQGSVSGVTYSLLGLSMSTLSLNYFNINDDIYIDKVNKQINQYYDGPATSIAISSPYLVTNIDFGITQSNESGYITSISRFTATSSYRYTYNGTRQYDEIAVDFGKLLIGTNSGQFLSNYTGYKPIFTNQYETIGFLYNYDDINKGLDLGFRIYDTSFNLLNTQTQSNIGITASPYVRYEYGIGTKNLSTGFSFSTPTEGYYTITLKTIGTTNSVLIKRQVLENCSIYDNVRIMFLNRLGSFEFWNFQMDSKKSTNIQRTEFNKILNYNYQVGDRGLSVLSIRTEDNFSINTDWITEYDYNFLAELVTSPEVYIIDEVTLNKLPIIIIDTQYDYKTTLRDKLFNLNINFKFAFKTNLQTN